MKNRARNRIKLILLGCILVILAGMVVVFQEYRRTMDEAGSLVSAIQDGAGMAISSVRQTAVRNGETQWSLEAASAEYLNDEGRAVFTQPSVTFFMTDRGEVVMTAASGTVQTDTNDIMVSGDVVVKDQTYVLRTQTLEYDNAGHRMFTDDPVAISGAGFDLEADSASLDMKSRQAVLRGNVRGTLSEDVEL
jgi:LPS export ABC transporter protein LptC